MSVFTQTLPLPLWFLLVFVALMITFMFAANAFMFAANAMLANLRALWRMYLDRRDEVWPVTPPDDGSPTP